MTIVKGQYKLTLEDPNGSRYLMAWKIDDIDLLHREESLLRLSKRVGYFVDRFVRNESPEEVTARIEKEYEAKRNAV